MRFWDSSALIPVVLEEATSASIREIYGTGEGVVVWWAASVECASAVARVERQGELSAAAAAEALRRLDAHGLGWQTIEPTDEIRELARRFVRFHPLRAADALQLAAAYLAAERRPPTLELVTLDDRLREAAAKEGFVLVET